MPASGINPLFEIGKLPTTSAAAIREFNDRYIAAIGASVPTGWADMLGALVPTNAPQETFPVTQLRTLYQQTTGESRFKDLGERSFDIKTEEFDDGYRARLLDLFQRVFAYRQWQAVPARFVRAEEQHRHSCIAALLEDGQNQSCYDGASGFFATDHPANPEHLPGTTWSNLNAAGADVVSLANIETEVTSMKTSVLDENGNRMGVDPTHILVPLEREEPLRNLLAQSRVVDPGGAAAGVDNFYSGRFEVVGVKELTDTNDWYLVDGNLAREASPWISMRQNVPNSLNLRFFDESSDFFKDTGHIKVTSHIWYGFSLAIPHAIRKIVVA